jgi:hypothetical protein
MQYLDQLTEAWALSQVSATEPVVDAGDKRDLAMIDEFLSTYLIILLGESIGVRAYRLLKSYVKSQRLHVFDSLVAASANERPHDAESGTLPDH